MNQIIIIKIRLVHKNNYRKSHSSTIIKSKKRRFFLKKIFREYGYPSCGKGIQEFNKGYPSPIPIGGSGLTNSYKYRQALPALCPNTF